MKLLAKEQIKTLLSQKGKKQKDLVEKLSEMTGEKYTSNGLSHKMRRGSVTYNEMLLILMCPSMAPVATILGLM